jgi:methyl-accepting chemotaxis protein
MHDTDRIDNLVHAISHLVHEMREDREQRRHDNNKAILERLAQLEKNIMAAMDDIRLELGKINAQTTEIASDIDELIAKVGAGMTEAEVTEVIDGLKGISSTLEGVAAKYPVPPVEPPPVDPTA